MYPLGYDQDGYGYPVCIFETYILYTAYVDRIWGEGARGEGGAGLGYRAYIMAQLPPTNDSTLYRSSNRVRSKL
jgi:hypothetical protein